MRICYVILVMLLGLGTGFGQSDPAASQLSLDLRPRPYTPATDLSGLWVGELLQNEGGIADRFDLSMQLVQNGIFLSGTAYVKFGSIYAELKLSGYQQPNGSYKLVETEILRSQKTDDLLFCYKTYELRVGYNTKGILLTGPWWGRTIEETFCIPGSVRLQLKKKAA